MNNNEDTIKNYKETWEFINKITNGISDLTPVYNKFYKVYTSNFIKKQFESEGSYFLGYKWKPLSEKYKKWKVKHYPGLPILQLKRNLIKAAMGIDKKHSFVEINSKKLIFGIKNIPYAKIHQYGNKQEGAKVPARPYLFIPGGLLPFKALTYLKDELISYIKTIIKIAKERGLIK